MLNDKGANDYSPLKKDISEDVSGGIIIRPYLILEVKIGYEKLRKSKNGEIND
jgi:hypothetical protein